MHASAIVLVALAIGATTAGAIVLGVLVGFLRYEYVHWRIHFRAPRNARQELLRVHHREDHARVAHHVTLAGASNFGNLWPKRG